MKKTIFLFLFICISIFIFGQDLLIEKDDILVIQSPEGGYHLYIKVKDAIKSVLLTETTRDPKLELDNYAYRAKEYNKINGDEQRLLNGEFILPEKKLFSLIDSTPEKNTPLGEAFHIWIPYIILYGYEWSRNGEVEVIDGTFFNIRTFAKPYGDYSGAFKDNPFKLRVTQKPLEASSTISKAESKKITYSGKAVTVFSDLSDHTKGDIVYPKSPKEIISLLKKLLSKTKNKKIDLLFAIDSTESMRDDIMAVRAGITSILNQISAEYEDFRIGLVLYKDYEDDFLVRQACAFTNNISEFEKALSGFTVGGGRDIPEAVYEGLHLALLQPWRSSNSTVDKKLVLIGDAPPHSKPRGKIKKDTVEKLAKEKKVKIYSILLPHRSAY